MTAAQEQTVASVAAAVRDGSLDVESAVAALRHIEPSSNLAPPPRSVDEAYLAEVESDVVPPSDDNNPNRLQFGGKVSLADFQRMHDALLSKPGSTPAE